MLRLVLIASLLVAAFGSPLSLEPGRIVGGQNAEITEVPYQALLIYGDRYCGGCILSETVVVTAAHCSPEPARNYKVFVGTKEFNKGHSVGVSNVRIHPKYNSHNFDYDVALFFLATPLKFGPTVRPISLPAQDQSIADNTPALASGWGHLKEGGPPSRLLQKVTLPIINQQKCNQLYPGKITSRMVCAGLVGVGGKATCQGDSGGPLVANGLLLGITSWAIGCARPNYPGVSVRVPAVSNWIKQMLAQ